ncbi:MAG TPA: helix-turn-helix domain-containing protein [Anaerohalosphaeraceae bacterium]|nr:helix-turn-helix domain-containing protein [Anaerohalosphaeraceae bacterium]
MEVKNLISPQIITAAANMLSPFVPEITPTNLIAALKGHQLAQNAALTLEKPMTRKQVAELLGVSLLTVSRYLNAGKLRRIRLSGRSVRIDPASVRDFLYGENTEAESIEAI